MIFFYVATSSRQLMTEYQIVKPLTALTDIRFKIVEAIKNL